MILRTYIALARGEHITPSEIGAVKEIGEDCYPLVQINWTENAELKKQVCEARGLTPEQFDAKMIFPKPTATQNLVYSAELRRIFGLEKLRFMPEFDKNGNFILPKERGFYVPKIVKKQVLALEFYTYEILRRKKAA